MEINARRTEESTYPLLIDNGLALGRGLLNVMVKDLSDTLKLNWNQLLLRKDICVEFSSKLRFQYEFEKI